jgi:hypothetical protein
LPCGIEMFYSPSQECPVACHGDDQPSPKAMARQDGEANRGEARPSEDGLATPQFRWMRRSSLRGASFFREDLSQGVLTSKCDSHFPFALQPSHQQ